MTRDRRTADLVAAVEQTPIVLGTTRAAFTEFLSGSEVDPSIAHLAAIAWVVDPAHARVLLVEHGLVGWSCPGGHVEDGEAPLFAARRELQEETGLDAEPCSDLPLTIDTSLGCVRRPDARHWTLGFLFEASPDAVLRPEPGHEVAWFPLDRLPVPRAPDLDIVVPRLRPEHDETPT